MPQIPRSGARRTAKLAGLPLGMASRAAGGLGRRALGRGEGSLSEELVDGAAEQLFAVLGELKGGAMKVGQALSVYEAGMPERYAAPFREALAGLQSEAPPMDPGTVRQVLDRQLGTRWPERFRDFDTTACAAASIGQVHRAVWSDGREVAVKIQYPGADEALRSDLRQLRRLAPLLRPLNPGTDIKAVIDELYASSVSELDYRNEAAAQRTFHLAYPGPDDPGAGDARAPRISVPPVFAASPRVLVTGWVEGRTLGAVVRDGDAGERDSAALLLTRLQFSAPELAGMMHGDPHPGNFMLTPDGRLVAVDFGAAIPMPGGMPAPLVELMRLAVHRRGPELVDLLRAQGYLSRGADPEPQEALDFLEPFTAPMRSPEFTFDRAWLQQVVADLGDVTGRQFQTARSFALPRDYAMIHRVLSGSVGILCQLGATAPYRDEVDRWMPRILEDSPGD